MSVSKLAKPSRRAIKVCDDDGSIFELTRIIADVDSVSFWGRSVFKLTLGAETLEVGAWS